MKAADVMTILIDNKKGIMISTFVCLVIMFICKESTITVALATLMTAPYLIAILNGDRIGKDTFFKHFGSISTYKYALVSLFALVVSIIPSYFASLLSHSEIISKSLLVIVYSLSYSLIAPVLYKIATATHGVKYNCRYVVYTMLAICTSELCIYCLKSLSLKYYMTAFLTAPLVCLVYVLSLYVLTFVNLSNNKHRIR